MAPWYTEDCRKARQALAEAKRNCGKGDQTVVHTTRAFHQVCLKGRAEFAITTPDMLKYHPKRFWGLLCKNKNVDVGVSAQQFA